MRNFKHAGYTAFSLLGLIWGSNFIFMKWASELITPGQIVFLRVLSGFLPILAYALFRGSIRREHLRYWHHFFVMSLLATSIYYYAFARGTSLLLSGVAGMLSAAIPLCSFVAAVLFLKEERIDTSKSMGIALGFLGVMCIARPWESGAGTMNLEGVACMLAGSLSVGLSFVYARKFISRLDISPDALSTYQVGLALLLLCFITDFDGITRIGERPEALWGVLLGLGLTGTGLAYVLYYFIIDKLGAVTAASVTYIPPLVALFIGCLLVGEPIGALDICAMILILAGVFLLRKKTVKTGPGRPISVLPNR